MNKVFKAFLSLVLLAFVLIPSTKALAAVAPSQPSGLSLACQSKSKFMFSWNYDPNIAISTDNGNFGYELVVTTLKNKKIKSFDLNVLSNYSNSASYDAANLTPNVLIATADYSKMYMTVSNGKMQNQPFKIKVRAYTFDSMGAKLYGQFSAEKVIVPRPTINKFKAQSRTSGKITWKKIKGAKSYTVYVSYDGGTKFKKKGTTKGNTFTVKGMSLYKEFPVYVVANGIKCKKKKYSSTKAEAKTTNASTITIYLR